MHTDGRKLSMEPREFIDLAGELVRRNDEASLRSGVSRAYYALHNEVRVFLEKNQIALPHDAKTHARIAHYLMGSGIADVKFIGKALDDLRGDRNEADYDMQSNRFGEQRTASLVELKARKSFEAFGKFITNSHRRKSLVEGVNESRRKAKETG